MNQQEFMGSLKKSLRKVRGEEREEIVADYLDHFRAGLDNGKTEEEISSSLGNPKTIGKSYTVDSLLSDDAGRTQARGILAAVFASVSLGFFNLVFILGPFLVLTGVLVGMWAAALGLGIGGIAGVLGLILQPILPAAFSVEGMNIGLLIFGSIGATALGFLAVLGMWQLTKLFGTGTGKFLKFNAQFIRRSKENRDE